MYLYVKPSSEYFTYREPTYEECTASEEGKLDIYLLENKKLKVYFWGEWQEVPFKE